MPTHLNWINQLISYSNTRAKALPKIIFYKMKSSVVQSKSMEGSGSCSGSGPLLVMKAEEQSDNEEDTLAP